jgi:hypothetical protein
MNLPELLALVDEYHITDRRLMRARKLVIESPNQQNERDFRKETRRYFLAVAREARADLADVDRKLDDIYQRQYNLHAERAVLQRRMEGAGKIMAELDEAAK